jgi:hypothetical protein
MGQTAAPSTPQVPLSRLGFHYFPDTLHYREVDLQTWLPVLQSLGASWLVLRSEMDRAIPEQFLRGLKKAGIEPVIQFDFAVEDLPDVDEAGMLFDLYARWGARYLVFYDRPNARKSWPATSWVQQELVERFLDRFLPLANRVLKAGMLPVFPPLEPGGSYWDTAFLRSALQAMQRRKQDALLDNLVLSAYAWTAPSRSLDWGGGGPERWPQAWPYQTPDDSQDQRGFRVYEWYLAIARSVLHQPCPVILFQAGLPGDPLDQAASSIPAPMDADTAAAIARLLDGEKVLDPLAAENTLEPVPAEVIACNFWLLSAGPASPWLAQAWFQAEGANYGGAKHPAVEALCAWQRERLENGQAPEIPGANRAIRHYLLLPGYEWGVSDWYLEVIRPFVKKYRPTVGFVPEEAERSARVTIVGNPQNYPEDLLDRLKKAGCWIEQINGDGTNIASQLAER